MVNDCVKKILHKIVMIISCSVIPTSFSAKHEYFPPSLSLICIRVRQILLLWCASFITIWSLRSTIELVEGLLLEQQHSLFVSPLIKCLLYWKLNSRTGLSKKERSSKKKNALSYYIIRRYIIGRKIKNNLKSNDQIEICSKMHKRFKFKVRRQSIYKKNKHLYKQGTLEIALVAKQTPTEGVPEYNAYLQTQTFQLLQVT